MVLAPAVATIALLLLGASGIAKLADPAPTTGAMRAARLPSGDPLTYLLAGFEILSAGLALALGGLAAAPAAIAYAAFAVFTFAAVKNRIPVQSCGCFGREDTPPTWVHVAYNLLAFAALGSLVFSDGTPLMASLTVFEMVLYLLFAGVGAFASYLLLARLPALLELSKA